ncbi:MAG: HAD-IIIA family hydrolase [Magnetococcales bacterium]|nr:HAD-IIIA family hydrolase [Magnetococcales bacterium]
MKNEEKFLLLDRDGVCNRDRSDYVRAPEELEILSGVPEALGRVRRAGYRVLLITNQACVGKGLVAPATLEAIHGKLVAAVAEGGGRIDGIFHCPHVNEDRCGCRKPAPGLILEARRLWGFVPEVTWMVGDSARDAQAARAAGCRPALVRTGHGADAVARFPEVPAFDHLPAFVDFLLG